MTELDKETVTSVARVFNTIKENEGDSDHISIEKRNWRRI